MKAPIAIVGSESYIGAALKKVLHNDGRLFSGIDLVNGSDPATVIGDVRMENFPDALPNECETVIHLAAISRDADCKNNPIEALKVNVEGTQRVVNSCVSKGVKQLIFASTEWVYGEVEPGESQRESTPLISAKVQNLYTLTKVAGEEICRFANSISGLSVTVLRFGIVYGPRQNSDRSTWSAVESLYHNVRTTESVTVGSLKTARRFIHVNDIAKGITKCIGRRGYETFNLSGDRLISLGEIIQTSAELLGKEIQVKETSPEKISIRNPENTYAKTETGWRPEIDIVAGLQTLEEQYGS